MLIQLLRLSTSNARCVGSVPGVETMTLHVMWSSQKVLKKKKKKRTLRSSFKYLLGKSFDVWF